MLTYTVQQLAIRPGFLTLEMQDFKKDMGRAVQAMQREIAALAQPTGDWASCNEMQGYLICRPLPAGKLEAILLQMPVAPAT